MNLPSGTLPHAAAEGLPAARSARLAPAAPWQWAAAPAALPWRLNLSITLERARRWEFWPAWLYYLPIVGWILWLGLRHRAPTVFTAANPALDAGGVVGERKHQALAPLQANAPELCARFVLLSGDAPTQTSAALAFAGEVGFPLVLKPDVGQRGRGVFIARDATAVREYLSRYSGEVIAQRYVAGEEYGVFIARVPDEPGVRVLSVVYKSFPAVLGDGQKSLRQLIAEEPRARLSAALLYQRWVAQLDAVPAPGERIPLVEIGSHCRGALFLDATHEATAELEDTLTRLAESVPGYHFGRVDLRVPSVEALRRGEGIQALELNGVTAESAHIYHPDTPLFVGYRALFAQWSLAFAIGAANAARGAPVTGPFELLRLFRQDLQRNTRWF